MIGHGWSDHFDPADFAVLDQKRFRHQNAGGPVEALESVFAAVRERALVDGTLIEYRVRPDYTSLPVHDRIAAMMDALHDKIVAEFELRQAIQGESIDRIGGLIGGAFFTRSRILA